MLEGEYWTIQHCKWSPWITSTAELSGRNNETIVPFFNDWQNALLFWCHENIWKPNAFWQATSITEITQRSKIMLDVLYFIWVSVYVCERPFYRINSIVR